MVKSVIHKIEEWFKNVFLYEEKKRVERNKVQMMEIKNPPKTGVLKKTTIKKAVKLVVSMRTNKKKNGFVDMKDSNEKPPSKPIEDDSWKKVLTRIQRTPKKEK